MQKHISDVHTDLATNIAETDTLVDRVVEERVVTPPVATSSSSSAAADVQPTVDRSPCRPVATVDENGQSSPRCRPDFARLSSTPTTVRDGPPRRLEVVEFRRDVEVGRIQNRIVQPQRVATSTVVCPSSSADAADVQSAIDSWSCRPSAAVGANLLPLHQPRLSHLSDVVNTSSTAIRLPAEPDGPPRQVEVEPLRDVEVGRPVNSTC